MLTKQEIIEQLKEINYPGFNRDIISFGVINNIEVSESLIKVKIVLKSQDPKVAEEIENSVKEHLKKKNSSFKIETEISIAPASSVKPPSQASSFLQDVKYKIASQNNRFKQYFKQK